MPALNRSHSFPFQLSDPKTFPRILFAEDDPDTREVIQYLLSDAGFQVTAAEKAAELLLLVNTERFDAFLPDKLDAGNIWCRTVPSHRRPTTPILFCSGAVTLATEEPRLRLGLKDTLQTVSA